VSQALNDQFQSGRSRGGHLPANFLTSVPTFACMSLLCFGESVLAFPNLLLQAVMLITPLALHLPQAGLSGLP